MPSTAPPAAFRVPRALRQQGLESAMPFTVTIKGAALSCSGVLGPLRRPLDQFGGGHRLVQTFTGTILKSLLPVAPVAHQTTLQVAQASVRLNFKVVEVSGHEPYEVAWRFVASRSVLPSEV